MALGIPIICSNTGGLPEMVTNGEEGFLFQAEDYKQLAKNIHSLLANPSLREAMSINARKKFLGQFEKKKGLLQQHARF